jgi:hypothetical protein
MGIPLADPTSVFCDNESVVKNSRVNFKVASQYGGYSTYDSLVFESGWALQS